MQYICHNPIIKEENIITKPLPEELAKTLLKTGQCHVDHEGFDLNEIERAYYEVNNIKLYHDDTWYKDGGGAKGTTAILQPWFIQTGDIQTQDNLIIDHSHWVFKYPIMGEGRKQIQEYARTRPELYRLLSVQYKCGLDLCIDYLNVTTNTVEPILHIEWDFNNPTDLIQKGLEVQKHIQYSSLEWNTILIPTILRYNRIAKQKMIDAFTQADTRSMILMGEKAYQLIPTL